MVTIVRLYCPNVQMRDGSPCVYSQKGWIPRVAKPLSCPRCHTRLSYKEEG